ncbi:hypothetical protein GCM10010145_52170 [Streptomyces ruber]|uniref:Uncharacterized protein n=2 Tax=Streptomyces TaxID=1883 RepID=A0A918EXE2_9ACTN|nr:hypothetical protein [Streptomyces ruber]GGQ75994.1 hypothetical protein GCM10010145_52170 [Streptomyces ruber]
MKNIVDCEKTSRKWRFRPSRTVIIIVVVGAGVYAATRTGVPAVVGLQGAAALLGAVAAARKLALALPKGGPAWLPALGR